MNEPLPLSVKSWKQPTSVDEDGRYSGCPWRVFTPGSIIQNDKRMPYGSVSGQYIKIPEELVQGSNIAVVYRDMAMLLPHDHPPAYTKPASFKNPQIYNFYPWLPNAYRLDGHWMALGEYVTKVMPGHRSSVAAVPVNRDKDYWQRRRELSRTREETGIEYICTCGAGHRQTIYKELGDRPNDYCPHGGLMVRVVESSGETPVKYVCTCGKSHTRTTVPSQKPERCPDGGEMVEAYGI